MARTSTYLNFTRHTEEAFLFYKKVFGTDFSSPPQRMGDVPPMEGQPQIADSDKRLIMHIELPILGGHSLMEPTHRNPWVLRCIPGTMSI
jgi:PhnB protein